MISYHLVFYNKYTVNPNQYFINYLIQFEVPKFFYDDLNCFCIFSDYVSIILNSQVIFYFKRIDRILYDMNSRYYKKCFRLDMMNVFCLSFVFILNENDSETFRNYLILFYPFSVLAM